MSKKSKGGYLDPSTIKASDFSTYAPQTPRKADQITTTARGRHKQPKLGAHAGHQPHHLMGAVGASLHDIMTERGAQPKYTGNGPIPPSEKKWERR
jgi:hypothetical protein